MNQQKDYELLYQSDDQTGAWDAQRMGVKVKSVYSGDMLDVDAFPLWKTAGAIRDAEAAMGKATKEAQVNLNLEHSRRRMLQLADANFGRGDWRLTLTYDTCDPSLNAAKRLMRNFIDRLRRLYKKAGKVLRYIYVFEYQDANGERVRMHQHVFLSGGVSAEAIEAAWGLGYANCGRLQPSEDGLAEWAKYITKNRGAKGTRQKRWVTSKNLRQPKVTESKSKLSVKKLRAMAFDFESMAKPVMEKLYPGYTLVSCGVKYSDYVDGAYIRCRMRRTKTQALAQKRGNAR